jgi:hypothetical protein
MTDSSSESSYVIVPTLQAGPSFDLREVAKHLASDPRLKVVVHAPHEQPEQPFQITVDNLAPEQAKALQQRFGDNIVVSPNLRFPAPEPLIPRPPNENTQ